MFYVTNYRECIKLITFVISRKEATNSGRVFFISGAGQVNFSKGKGGDYTGELFSITFRGERVDAYVIFRDVLGNIFSGKAATTKKN